MEEGSTLAYKPCDSMATIVQLALRHSPSCLSRHGETLVVIVKWIA